MTCRSRWDVLDSIEQEDSSALPVEAEEYPMEDLMVEHDGFVVQQSTKFAGVVRSKRDRRLDRKLRLSLGGKCMVMLEAADPKGCTQGRLPGP